MKIGRNKQGVLYWTDYIDGTRIKRESKEWKTQREAREHYKNFIDNFDVNESRSLTYEELVNKYIEHISLTHRQSTVQSSKNIMINNIGQYFSDIKINKIDHRMIKQFQKEILKKNYAQSYLWDLQSKLNILLEFAVTFEYLNKNPFKLIPFVKKQVYEPRKQMTILTKEEFDSFISVIDNQVHRALFSVLYWCGLRIGELMALSIQDYDRRVKILHIYKNFDHKNRVITATKTNSDRFVSVPEVCANEIDTLLDVYTSSSDGKLVSNAPLFSYDGIIPKGTLDRIKNQYIKLANETLESNIPTFTFHELRHTHVSTLINLDMKPKDIAERLGHSVEMVNNTYSHLFPERKDLLLDKLNDFSKKT